MRSALRFVVVFAVVACWATPAAARAQPGTSVLFGVVRDSMGRRLDQVEILILRSTLRTQSDDSGAYRLTGVPGGVWKVQFRRVGYYPDTIEVRLGAGEAKELTDSLTPSVVLLPEVLVSDATRGKMAQFNTRRARGVGTFVTRADIEKRAPHRLSELLRYVAGVNVGQRMAGEPQPVQMRRSAASSMQSTCVVQLYVDGQMYRNGNLDDFPPAQVEAMEVYRSASEIPADFRTQNATCGVIALWTRDPDAARRRP